VSSRSPLSFRSVHSFSLFDLLYPAESTFTMASGQLFSKKTQALFYNYKQLPIQRMLDFDFLCGKMNTYSSIFYVYISTISALFSLLICIHISVTLNICDKSFMHICTGISVWTICIWCGKSCFLMTKFVSTVPSLKSCHYIYH
jgi:hypothetical protein